MMNLFEEKIGVAMLMVVVLYCFPATAQPLQTTYFDQYLEKKNSNPGGTVWAFEKFCPVSTSLIARRVLESYGSMFVANDSVSLPSTCVQKGEAQVLEFQKKTARTPIYINGVYIDLQSAASKALQLAIDEAALAGLKISPFDGTIAGGRSYGDTLMLWNSRVFPALAFWTRRGKLSATDNEIFGKLELENKIAKILEWESRGLYFSTDRSRSILTSTAPPGTSQHLALIAFDVVEYRDPMVRLALNRNGWFQTVVDDPGHFTYLGVPESELPNRGLIAVSKNGHMYWIPNLSPVSPIQPPTN